MDLSQVHLYPHYPDSTEVRSDVADYYFEVERFDREVGELMEKLQALGELENTLFVVTSDHGMPFPRGKTNLYDCGVHVPLAIRWPARVSGGRTVTDLVSLTDLAPTFLAAAGLPIPQQMTGYRLARCWKVASRDASRRRAITFISGASGTRPLAAAEWRLSYAGDSHR